MASLATVARKQPKLVSSVETSGIRLVPIWALANRLPNAVSSAYVVASTSGYCDPANLNPEFMLRAPTTSRFCSFHDGVFAYAWTETKAKVDGDEGLHVRHSSGGDEQPYKLPKRTVGGGAGPRGESGGRGETTPAQQKSPA